MNGDFRAVASDEPSYTAQDALSWLRRALREMQQFEWRARHRDGSPFWAEVSIRRAAIQDRDCLLARVRDIRERKRTEEALRSTSEQLRHAVSRASPAATIARDLEGHA